MNTVLAIPLGGNMWSQHIIICGQAEPSVNLISGVAILHHKLQKWVLIGAKWLANAGYLAPLVYVL